MKGETFDAQTHILFSHLDVVRALTFHPSNLLICLARKGDSCSQNLADGRRKSHFIHVCDFVYLLA